MCNNEEEELRDLTYGLMDRLIEQQTANLGKHTEQIDTVIQHVIDAIRKIKECYEFGFHQTDINVLARMVKQEARETRVTRGKTWPDIWREESAVVSAQRALDDVFGILRYGPQKYNHGII